MNKYIICTVLLALACCAIGTTTQRGKLPEGYYNIEFFGDGNCAGTPSKFHYKQLDVCSINLYAPEYYETTSCSNKEYKTLDYCADDCSSCSATSSGPIGCSKLSGVYSILRTCGPAPQILHGNTWLLEFKSASANCSNSILESGTVANFCFPSSLNSAVQYQCTATTRTEITYNDCKLFTCDCWSPGPTTVKQDIGKCINSKTFECVTI